MAGKYFTSVIDVGPLFCCSFCQNLFGMGKRGSSANGLIGRANKTLKLSQDGMDTYIEATDMVVIIGEFSDQLCCSPPEHDGLHARTHTYTHIKIEMQTYFGRCHSQSPRIWIWPQPTWPWRWREINVNVPMWAMDWSQEEEEEASHAPQQPRSSIVLRGTKAKWVEFGNIDRFLCVSNKKNRNLGCG